MVTPINRGLKGRDAIRTHAIAMGYNGYPDQ